MKAYTDLEQSKIPELKKSEDKRIRTAIIYFISHTPTVPKGIIGKETMLAWLEKQGEPSIKWNKNTEGNKPQVNHSVLMKTTHGVAEGEWQGERWHQYRWAGIVRDSDVLSWMELSDLEKQGEQKLPIEKLPEEMKTIGESLGFTTQEECDEYNEMVTNLIMGDDDKGEQKTALSREDEKIRQTIINEFKQCSEWYCSNGLTKEDCINWLNKQEYFEWGDEDNENMNSLCVLLDQMVSINAIGNEHSIEYKNWLKSIKQRMGG